MWAKRCLSALKRFALGAVSGGAYPVGKTFEKEVRIAAREERRRVERDQEADES